MHKLMEYVCNELEDIERKAERDGSLSMTEVQYADTLLRMKKNILKTDEMSEDGSYGMYRDSRSYSARGRNARRDSRGRYASGSMSDQLRDMMDDAPDESTRMEIQRFIDKLDRR